MANYTTHRISKIWLPSTFFISLILTIISLIFFHQTSPIALQKILSLKILDEEVFAFEDNFKIIEKKEILSLLDSIPSRRVVKNSWFVNPKSKYEDTILNGNGNCSNLAFGVMYSFDQSKHQAAIVHFLRKDFKFLYGNGHSLLLINLGENNALLDFLDRGNTLRNGHLINIKKLNFNESDSLDKQIYSNLKVSSDEHFNIDYLSQVTFALIPQKEVTQYFKFIDAIYVHVGLVYLEKLFFDTIALAFGKYPGTYVTENFFWETYKNAKLFTFFSYLFLLFFHLTYVTFILMIIKKIYKISNYFKLNFYHGHNTK